MRFALKLWGLQICFTWLRQLVVKKGPPCKEAVDFTRRDTCSLFCPDAPMASSSVWQHFVKLCLPVSPEFGKLMEKPVPTYWVSWPGEERKLEGDWEMAMAEKPASHTEMSWPAVGGHLCRVSTPWVGCRWNPIKSFQWHREAAQAMFGSIRVMNDPLELDPWW